MSVRVEKKDHVTTVILDNPEVKNAVNPATATELATAFRDFEADENAHVAVLWGDHGCFCAGANLKEVATATNLDMKFDPLANGPMGPSRIAFTKPVIAAVAGYAVAGGLELAVMCDLRVVEEDAVFGVFCRRWGIPLIDGGTIRLPRLIGASHALDMILTGRPVGAEEALRMGLANRVVPKGTSRQAAEELAAGIAAFPQVTMQNDRMSAHEQWSMTMDQALRNEFEHGIASLEGGVLQAGAQRFAAGAGRHGSFGDA